MTIRPAALADVPVQVELGQAFLRTPTCSSAAAMTTVEARTLTDRIKGAAEQLWMLLLEAHDREAWRVLGYASWREYAKHEFSIGQSHAYRLLDQGRVVRALQEAAGLSPNGEIVVSEIEAREIKPQLPLVTADIKDRIKAGETPVEAVQTAVGNARVDPPSELPLFSQAPGPAEPFR